MFMKDLREPGDELEVSDYKGEKLIGRGVAKEITEDTRTQDEISNNK